MNILDKLKEKFDTVEPIFDYEIYELGFSDEDIADTLEQNKFEELIGVSEIPCRIFYIVGYSDFLNDYIRLFNTSESVITKYFLGKNFEFGFYYGLTLQNKLGLSTQVPAKIYIQSNKAKQNMNVGYFVIISNEDYVKDDSNYICLAEILNFKGEFEYDISLIYEDLSKKCTDLNKLNMYKSRRI